MYFSQSADAKPGRGASESLSPNDNFSELAEIPHWRRKLSNFHVAPFELDNRTWNTVEHFYQASKFKQNNPQFYHQFCLESGSSFCNDPARAKGAGGKSGKYQGELLRLAAVVIDPDFFNNRSSECMLQALRAKFEQNNDLREILQLTAPAELWHKTRGTPLIRMYSLEAIRDELMN